MNVKPKIKIKRFYEKVCSACNHMATEFGEYDTTGYAYCSIGKRWGNLNHFPICNAKYCKDFSPVSLKQDDGWCYMMDFEKVFSEEQSMDKLINYLNFKERMGDYKIGRLL